MYFYCQFQNTLQDAAMNDPNSHVYTHSTVMSFGPDGQPKVVEHSSRKAGDVKETRRFGDILQLFG